MTIDWCDVDYVSALMADLSKEAFERVRSFDLPTTVPAALWYNPFNRKTAMVHGTTPDEGALAPWRQAALSIQGDCSIYSNMDLTAIGTSVKLAYSPGFRKALEAMQLLPGESIPGTGIPNAPGPLASMLAGGLLGAGLGYGGGALAEAALPADWTRGRLRRTAALVGALAGASPGALFGVSKLIANAGEPEGNPLSSERFGTLLDSKPWGWDTDAEPMPDEYYKAGSSSFGNLPAIDVTKFNETIWGDPFVAPRLSMQEQAAAASVVNNAARIGSNSTHQPAAFVTPFDVARLAVGMGSGYASGFAVGKALGWLTGAPNSVQDKLKQTGMWAGVVKSVVPALF